MKKGMIAIVIAALCAALAVPALAFGLGAAPANQAAPSQLANACAGQACDAVTVQAERGAASVTPAVAMPATCPGYVDADGDGICDNHARGNSGSGYHHGNGAASPGDPDCPGYVDADGDGTCDNYAGRGHHGGHGAHHR